MRGRLLADGADPSATDDRQDTPLHFAAFTGVPGELHLAGETEARTACVEALLAAGANPSAANVDGDAPAHVAASKDAAAVLHRMLAADPAAALLCNRVGHTTLHAALECMQGDAAHCLLQLTPVQPASELLAAIRSAHTTMQQL